MGLGAGGAWALTQSSIAMSNNVVKCQFLVKYALFGPFNNAILKNFREFGGLRLVNGHARALSLLQSPYRLPAVHLHHASISRLLGRHTLDLSLGQLRQLELIRQAKIWTKCEVLVRLRKVCIMTDFVTYSHFCPYPRALSGLALRVGGVLTQTRKSEIVEIRGDCI